MAKTIHYSPDMVCPYCGNAEFYNDSARKPTTFRWWDEWRPLILRPEAS